MMRYTTEMKERGEKKKGYSMIWFVWFLGVGFSTLSYAAAAEVSVLDRLIAHVKCHDTET